MADTSDEILRTYIENVLRVQQERDRTELSDEDLKQVALEAGMTDADLDHVRQRINDCLNRGKGFIRYRNWNDAIEELEQARALAPYNIDALGALATAYAGRWQSDGGRADGDRAREIAERVLHIDSSNDTALRIVSALQTKRKDLLAREVGTAPGTSLNRRTGFVLIGAAVLIGLVLLVVFVRKKSTSVQPTSQPTHIHSPIAPKNESPPPPPPPSPTSGIPRGDTAAGIANVVLSFGRYGTGPGLFNDARAIAVDGAGEVYVAEYSSGRIQVFDSIGNYLRQWTIGDDIYIRGMAVGRNGTVYVTHSGRIFRYEGATGKPLGEVRWSGGPGFVSVAMMADGGLVAGWDGLWRGGLLINPKSDENVVVFNAVMKPVRTLRHPISSIGGGVVFDPRVAADGLGNIYIVEESGQAIYHFNPQGKYVDRFGEATDGSQGMHGAREIAVDGRGRVFVTDRVGVREFDGEGRYLGSIGQLGSTDAIAFNGKDEMYTVSRTKVVKYTMPR